MAARDDPALQTPAQPPPDKPLHGWDLDNDALAHALSWLTRHHGRERTPESLLAGLPADIGEAGRLGPDQAIRVLNEAGYNAGLLQRRVGELSDLLLPAVLLLKEADCCIVVARRSGVGESGRYDIVMPGREHTACTASEAELEGEYTGVALVATPRLEGEGASNAGATPAFARDAAEHHGTEPAVADRAGRAPVGGRSVVPDPARVLGDERSGHEGCREHDAAQQTRRRIGRHVAAHRDVQHHLPGARRDAHPQKKQRRNKRKPRRICVGRSSDSRLWSRRLVEKAF